MIEVETTAYHRHLQTVMPPVLAPLPVEDQLNVPVDVVNKFDVVPSSETVEALIEKKLLDETREGEEAFYIIDLGTVVKKYKEWISELPRVKPYYAIKCNNNTAVVRTLAGLGANFDCASKAEIQQILGCGVSPSRIIYANPTKMKAHIKYAKSSGVDLMTFDNADELEKISECFPESKLLLRIITDDSNSVCRFSTKFGAPLGQCASLLAKAKSLDLNVVGISFHVGSGCMSTSSFESAISSAAKIFKEAEAIGYHMNMLDLGGGFPGTNDGHIAFSEIAACIRPLLDQLFPVESGVQIIAEPGRYMVAQSHTLIVNVFAKRTVLPSNSEETKRFLYYINDGVYQSFNCILFDHASPTPLVLHENGRTEKFKSTVFGPTCDSMDCIGKDLELPELEVGEWLYFKNMGAYTVAAASPFNGFKSCPTLFYVNSEC